MAQASLRKTIFEDNLAISVKYLMVSTESILADIRSFPVESISK